MTKWRSVKLDPPPKEIEVWAYDVFYGNIHLALWDRVTKRLHSIMVSDDDYSLDLWYPCIWPDLPTKEQIEESQK